MQWILADNIAVFMNGKRILFGVDTVECWQNTYNVPVACSHVANI